MTRTRGLQLPGMLAAAALLLLCGAVRSASANEEIKWSDCPGSAGSSETNLQQCALIPVPLDYRRPYGRKINIAISRIKAADPAKRHGVLFLNPGGPGGPGLDLPQLAKLIF